MMNKRVRILSACALALAVTISGLTLPGAYAANAVDTGKTDCSIEFNLSKNVYASQPVVTPDPDEGSTEGQPVDKTPSFEEELAKCNITVKLYRVAAITETGAYRALEGFGGLNLDKINSQTSAADWEAKAKAAKEVIGDNTDPTAEVTLVKGKGKITGLATGMYLIAPQEVQSPYFTYTFKENLISLPNNYYYVTDPRKDEWVYNLTGDHAVGLKPEREERKGDLVINKTLTSYNATVGGATFVFRVDVTKMDGTSTSNVYKMAFSGTGSESLTIRNLPAGADVTVTEIYSGASYKLISDNNQTTKIIAKEKEDDAVSVSFTNGYNGGQNGGSGVVNRFFKNGEKVDYQNDLNAGRGEE